MPDDLPDALDRLDISTGELTEFGSIQAILSNRLGTPPSPFQIARTEEHLFQQTALAESAGFTIGSSVLLEGRKRVRRTTLRDARGRFVRRGGRAVRQFLEEEVGF